VTNNVKDATTAAVAVKFTYKGSKIRSSVLKAYFLILIIANVRFLTNGKKHLMSVSEVLQTMNKS